MIRIRNSGFYHAAFLKTAGAADAQPGLQPDPGGAPGHLSILEFRLAVLAQQKFKVTMEMI